MGCGLGLRAAVFTWDTGEEVTIRMLGPVAWGPSVDLPLHTLLLVLRVCPLEHWTNESGGVLGRGTPGSAGS